MQKLTYFVQGEKAHALQVRLENAGVHATVTHELANFLGQSQFAVWVTDDADPRTVDHVTAAFTAETDQHQGPATRVDPEDDSTFKCNQCTYDLQGQTADGRCPECGHPYFIVTLRRCPQCNAEGPSDFDVCWKCSATLHN